MTFPVILSTLTLWQDEVFGLQREFERLVAEVFDEGRLTDELNARANALVQRIEQISLVLNND